MLSAFFSSNPQTTFGLRPKNVTNTSERLSLWPREYATPTCPLFSSRLAVNDADSNETFLLT